ncbi:MAG TPA: putative glycoside hydrolase [Acidimicrobiia bacterium]|nr:putative glycoside hydrolase [Acidimicrobiia bacterium]
MRSPALLAILLILAGCTFGVEGGERSTSEGGDPDEPAEESAPLLQLVGTVSTVEGDPVPAATVTVAEEATTSAPDGWFDLMVATPGPINVHKPAWVGTEMAWDGSQGFVELTIEPVRIRGLRVGGDAAGDDQHFDEILDLAESTAVNALVFDTKQEGGRVFYDTEVALANESGAAIDAYDPRERTAQAEAAGLYTITRIVTFEDDFWAQARPEIAFEGGWIDPTATEGWEYPIALAEEACELGFDEVQFDYIRFPSEAAAQSSGQLEMTEEDRVTVIEAFVHAASTRVRAKGCAVSADVFGIIVSAGNDQGIGQRPEEMSRHLDAFSPMIYPSHYSPGWLGFDDPNDHPYDVTSDAIEDAMRRIEPGVVLRPWLQAFWWTNDEIRRSIQAAEDHGVGWLLWNAVSNFDRAAIPTDAELAPAAP